MDIELEFIIMKDYSLRRTTRYDKLNDIWQINVNLRSVMKSD